MEDMAIPQPTRFVQLGKMYSSYFRPDDVRVLAITTNCNKERQWRKTRFELGLHNILFNVLYYFFSKMRFLWLLIFFLHSIKFPYQFIVQ